MVSNSIGIIIDTSLRPPAFISESAAGPCSVREQISLRVVSLDEIRDADC